MGLMKWLGWISLKKYDALEDSREKLASKASAQLEEIVKLKAALALAKQNHVDVAGMLDQAMESVTSAVGFVAVMDAAKKKLERLDDASRSPGWDGRASDLSRDPIPSDISS